LPKLYYKGVIMAKARRKIVDTRKKELFKD